MDTLQKIVRDHTSSIHACNHCFTCYKTDHVACKVIEMVGEGYIELYCPDCESFETDDLDFWLSELDIEDLDKEELLAYQEWLERKLA